MKRIVFVGKMCLAASMVFLTFSCQPSAPETNRAGATSGANTNSSREPINVTAIEAELTKIERDWPRVVRERDVEAVRRIYADDAIFVSPDGSLGNKEQDLKDAEAGAFTAESWEVTDLKVNVLDEDAAIVSGRAIVKGGKYRRSDGKTLDISGQYRFIDTFARRDGRWQLVAGAGAPIRELPMAAAAESPAGKESPSPSPKQSY